MKPFIHCCIALGRSSHSMGVAPGVHAVDQWKLNIAATGMRSNVVVSHYFKIDLLFRCSFR
jgi:hypothetical protein